MYWAWAGGYGLGSFLEWSDTTPDPAWWAYTGLFLGVVVTIVAYSERKR